MSHELEQQFAEYLGTSFVPFPGWERPSTSGRSDPLSKFTAELRAKSKRHSLNRMRLEREEARKAYFKAAAKPVGPPPNTRLARIAYYVCSVMEVPVLLLRSPRRQIDLVRARHVFFYLCRENTPVSFPVIGAWCGDRDHSTVQHGAKKVAANLADYPEIEKIKTLLSIEAVERMGLR